MSVDGASTPPAFGLSFVGLSWHHSLSAPVCLGDRGDFEHGRPDRRRADTLAACGARPVRRLALLMADLGPVPTLEEVRAMLAADGWTRRHEGRAAMARLKAQQSAMRAAEHGRRQAERMVAWNAQRKAEQERRATA